MTITKRRWLFLGILLFVATGWAMGQYDYGRLVAGKHPLFARFQLHLADGGSVQYWGLGYAVTDLHEMRWGLEMQIDVKETPSYRLAPYAPFRVGQRLDYLSPFVSREHTRFVVETNK
jgi:hypothetical protein